jgi:hypothetical protein
VRFLTIEVVETRWGGEGATSVASSRRGGMGGQEGRGERWWKEEETARRPECIRCLLSSYVVEQGRRQAQLIRRDYSCYDLDHYFVGRLEDIVSKLRNSLLTRELQLPISSGAHVFSRVSSKLYQLNSNHKLMQMNKVFAHNYKMGTYLHPNMATYRIIQNHGN